jgi:Gpi18-like mannosyltransferase
MPLHFDLQPDHNPNHQVDHKTLPNPNNLDHHDTNLLHEYSNNHKNSTDPQNREEIKIEIAKDNASQDKVTKNPNVFVENFKPQIVFTKENIQDQEDEEDQEPIKLFKSNSNDKQSQSGERYYNDEPNDDTESRLQANTVVEPIDHNFEQTNNFVSDVDHGFNFDNDKEQAKPNPIFASVLGYFAEFGQVIRSWLTVQNILFGLIILLTIRIKLAFFPFVTNDYNSFLKPWMQYIIDNGSFEAFRVKFYDYTPAYVYLLWLGTVFNANFLLWIKGISVLFDFLLAFYVSKIVAIKYPKIFKMAFLVTLMAPAVIFNGSLWGQCDVIYSTMVMGCLYYILTNKQIKAAFFFAIALCLKLQSMFFAPVFLWLIVTKNIPKMFVVTLSALFIGLYLLMILPISQGVIFQNNPSDTTKNARPLLDSTSKTINGNTTELKDTRDGLLTIFLNQPKNYSHIVMGPASSMYQWVDDKNYEYFYQNGLTIAIVVILILAYYLVSNNIINVDNDVIIKLSLISVLAVPFLLPKMHERYFFLADIMALVYAFWFPKKFWVGVAISFISFTVYIQAVINGNIPSFFRQEYNALWVMFILIYLIYDLIKGLRKSYKLVQTVNN